MSSRHSTSSSNGGTAGWTGARHTMFLRVHSADKLQLSTSHASYCKVYIGETPVVTSTTNMSNLLLNDKPMPDHRTFHTKVTASKLKTTALWNEKFEIPLDKLKKQILSIRVKSQHQIYSPSIGACAIPLKQLKIGSTIDQNFPLFKGSTQVGTIRLQIMLRDNHPGRDEDDDTPRNSISKRVATDLEATKRKEEAEREHERLRLQKLEEEKRRIEQEMERLRIEEEERVRRKFEEEERRLLEEERLAAERAEREREKEEKRRRKEQERLEEEEMVKKLLAESAMRKKKSVSISSDNQTDNDKSRASSSVTVLTSDDRDGDFSDGEGGKKMQHSMSASRRSSTLSLRDVIDEVVQDALPSDSDSDELDTEDEHEFVLRMAKLKLKLLKRKKMRRSMIEEGRRSTVDKDEREHVSKPVKKTSKSKMYRRSLSPSSSCPSSSDDELYTRKSKKKHHKKSKNQYSSSEDEDYTSKKTKKHMKSKHHYSSSDDEDYMSKKTKKKSKSEDDDGLIKALTPGQIAKKTGSAHSDQLSMGQVVEAAVNVAKVANADDDDDIGETAENAVDAVKSLVPIGKFLGRKLHEASAKVAQMKEKEQPTYYF